MSALREIIAKFGIELDDKELEKGHEHVEGMIGKLKEFGEIVITAFAVEKIKEFVFGLAEQAEGLGKQAEMLGVSAGALQEWQYAASLVGVGADEVTSAMMRLEKGAASAAEKGKGPAADAFRKLGITAKDASGEIKPVEQLMEEVADGLEKTEDPAKRTQIAMGLFGRAGAKLIPLLKEGSGGIRKYRAELEELGGGINEGFIEKSKEMIQNSKRLNMVWLSLKVTIVGALLPYLTEFLVAGRGLAQWILRVTEHSSLLQTGLALLAIKGFMMVSNAIGPLGAGLKMIGTRLLPLIIAFLLLEDAMTFLRGGDSLIGRAIDKAFGPGTSDKVRKWFDDVKKEVSGFFDDLKSRPGKLLDDWHVFTDQLSKDVTDLFGPTFGGILNTAGGMFVSFLDILTGGWTNFSKKTGAVWDEIKLMVSIVAFEFKNMWLLSIGAVQDGFTALWNGLLADAQWVLNMFRKIADALPGQSGVVKSIDDALSALESHKGAGDAVKRVQAAAADTRTGFAARDEDIQSRLNASAYAPQLITQVTVNVPPGTPENMANRVGTAAAQGAGKGADANLRAAHTALKPGGA